jgi:hypothetical protein
MFLILILVVESRDNQKDRWVDIQFTNMILNKEFCSFGAIKQNMTLKDFSFKMAVVSISRDQN